MLTRASIECTAAVVKFARLFRVTLLTWKDEIADRKLGYTTALGHKVIFWLLATYLSCEAVYHMGLLCLYDGKMDADGAKPYLKMIAHATSRVAGLGFAIVLAVKSKDAAYLYNQLLVLDRRFQGRLKSLLTSKTSTSVRK